MELIKVLCFTLDISYSCLFKMGILEASVDLSPQEQFRFSSCVLTKSGEVLGNHLHITTPFQASVSQNNPEPLWFSRSAPSHVAADIPEFFIFDVGCSYGYLQPRCPCLASFAISWDEVVSSAFSLLWLPMLGPLGEGGGYLTAVLVGTSRLVKILSSKWMAVLYSSSTLIFAKLTTGTDTE